jgi:hypothetical protein
LDSAPAAGGLYPLKNVTYRRMNVGKVADIKVVGGAVIEATLSSNSSPKIPCLGGAGAQRLGNRRTTLCCRAGSDSELLPQRDDVVLGPVEDLGGGFRAVSDLLVVFDDDEVSVAGEDIVGLTADDDLNWWAEWDV